MSNLKRLSSFADDLPDQFEWCVAGRILLLDGDAAIYKVAATTSNMETAKARFLTYVMTQKFLANAQHVRIYLTPRGCKKAKRGQLLGLKPYQGNRKDKKKPPLVEPLRQAIGRGMFVMPTGEDWYLCLDYEFEADDKIIMDAHYIGENAVVHSEDKDLRCWHGHFLDAHTNTVAPPVEGVGKLWWHTTPGGDHTLLGAGPIFFWAQMLMGDSADNVAGLKGCGKQAAMDLLSPFIGTTDESKLAEFVLNMYRQKNQNPWPEAYALWLYRSEEYGFAQHLNALRARHGFNPELWQWLREKFQERWYGESEASPDDDE